MREAYSPYIDLEKIHYVLYLCFYGAEINSQISHRPTFFSTLPLKRKKNPSGDPQVRLLPTSIRKRNAINYFCSGSMEALFR